MQTDKINDLSEKLTTLHEVFSRRISDRALSLWVEKLSAYIGPELDRVLDEATTQRVIPTLGDLIQTTQAAIRRNNQPKIKGREEFEEEDRQAFGRLSQEEQDARTRAADEFFEKMRIKLGYGMPKTRDSE